MAYVGKIRAKDINNGIKAMSAYFQSDCFQYEATPYAV